jgi:hypothetical protein
LGASIALLAACGATAKHPDAVTPATPSPSAMAMVCGDFSEIDSVVPPILDRLANGRESTPQYTKDEVVIDELSQRLYADASAFADMPPASRVFELSNRLSVDLNHLVYGYFMFVSPDQVAPADIPPVRADLAAIRDAITAGEFACPSH